MRNKTKRLFWYWLHGCFSRRSCLLPKRLFQVAYFELLARVGRLRPFQGMKLVSLLPVRVDSLSEVVDALELLRRTDPRRFARVERHIKRVVFGRFKQVGFYAPVGHLCGLRRQSALDSANPLAYVGYAAVLVHEATHALLDRLKFPPTAKNMKRIEALCTVEEARFLMKFPAMKGRVMRAYGYAEKWKGRPTRGA